jgi:hypothetical protein
MATESQILELRGLINEPDDSNGYDDATVAGFIDGADTLNAAASKVWYLKAGQYSSLVDVSESGSSRKLSDLMKNAQSMGKMYADADATPTTADSGIVIARIRRGFA